MTERLTGPIHVIGAGLLGTSLGLAARREGIEVWLSDVNPEHVRTAISLGAGEALPGGAKPIGTDVQRTVGILGGSVDAE